MNIEIANRLLQLRKERGLSQEDLAERIGISRQSVSKWERAEASPDTDNLIALARLYGVSLDELLLGGEPNENGENPPAVPEHACPGVESAYSLIPVQAPPKEDTPDAGEPGSIQPDSGPPMPTSPNGRRGKSVWLAFPYPVLVCIVYLLLGFLCDWWHPGWILFLTVPIYYSIADIVVHKRSFKHFAYPVLMVVLFLVLGFMGWWHVSWLVFLTVPLYYALFPDRDPPSGGC